MSKKKLKYDEFASEEHDKNILEEIAIAVDDQLAAQEKVADLEEQLRAAKAELRLISEDRLPSLMEGAGQSQITTTDGTIVTIADKIRGNIPKNDPGPAYKWLEDNGHDGLIKNKIEVRFDRNDQASADAMEKYLTEKYPNVPTDRVMSIHVQTLHAFLKSQMKDGVDVPLELFGCERISIAKLKQKPVE